MAALLTVKVAGYHWQNSPWRSVGLKKKTESPSASAIVLVTAADLSDVCVALPAERSRVFFIV